MNYCELVLHFERVVRTLVFADKFSSMFSPRQESVKAITNSATPRLPLRHDLGAGQSSNAVSFYSQESVTTSGMQFDCVVC